MGLKSGYDHRPQTQAPAVTLTARPDQARFHLQVEVVSDAAATAVPLLHRAAQRLVELLPQLGATLALEGLDLPHDSAKASGSPSRLRATLALPLSPDATFWDRAQRIAQIDDLLRALAAEGRKQKPALELRHDLPVCVVADPEARREALVARLHQRARSLGGDGAEVRLVGLRFDQPVTQRPLGVEAVELSLPVEGAAELTLR
jgi:hypothetical protein